MGLRESTKRNAQLTRQNDIFSNKMSFVCFFKERHHTAKAVLHWVPKDPNTTFLVSTFTLKMPERISPFSCSKICDFIILPKVY